MGCGVEIGNPKKPDPQPTSDSPTVIAGDPELVKEAMTGALDETFPAIAANYASSEILAMMLAPSATRLSEPPLNLADDLVPPKITRSCQANDAGDVTVIWTQQGDINKTLGALKKERQMQMHNDETRTARYSVPQITLGCNADLSRAKLSLVHHDDVNLELTVDKQRSLLVKRNDTVLRDNSTTVHVDFHSTYAKQPKEGDTFVVTRKINGSTTRATNLTTAKSGAFTLKSTITIDSSAPLVIAEKYDADESLSEKRIVSGTQTITHPNDAKIELSYDNLVFSGKDSCTPASGVISGKVYASDASQTPEHTYTINFDGSDEATLTPDTGDSQTIDWDACSDGLL